ncbi:uncharacterized protein LOC111329287 isoform X1 [Stylophora pistillata]|uniref:uncharacterized protein LOC111329287 isoform X1 n=1 Tax=Stylophora pistillata TaxID=50429 RepID=UPI000C03DD6B|nr:uncharacterized protein LOC111329287 isoform X1 [Stylophora pistillata]
MSAKGSVGNWGDSLQCFKMVLLGDVSVGKTSLIKALKNEHELWELPKEYRATTGAWITYVDITNTRRLLITDTSGKREYTSLVNLYLRHLHCIVLVFALDEPSSFTRLKNHWYQEFIQSFKGEVSNVAKFVVGTKIDVAPHSCTLQTEATWFSEEIGAEIWITSAHTLSNTYELFYRVAEKASTLFTSEINPVDIQDGSSSFGDHLVDDMLLGEGALVKYPDPVLLETEEEITDLQLFHQCVSMTGQSRKFTWGTWSEECSKEAVLKLEMSRHPDRKSNKLWACVMANAPPSTWQYENLEGVKHYGTTVKRQPTKTKFKDVKKLLFSSRDQLNCEREHGLFYMLLLSEDGRMSEVGLNSVSTRLTKGTSSEKEVVKNKFHFKPSPLSEKVACMNMSLTHAAVIEEDTARVSTWGHGDTGALGIDKEDLQYHAVLYFPLTVTSIDCQIKQVTCGSSFTLMLSTDGKVFSCGTGALGKLGHGDETDRSLPTLIESLKDIQAIAAGGDHAVALNQRGVLYQWGLDCADVERRRFLSKPQKVSQLFNVAVKSVVCGTFHTVCVANGIYYTGIGYAWGLGSDGQLGQGHCQCLSAPKLIRELYRNSKFVKQVSAGWKHSGLLTVDGEVYTCGNNAFGQLGYFTVSDCSDVPRKVSLGTNVSGDEMRAKELCCSEDYTMVLTTTGDVKIWGKCHYGSKLEDPIPFDVNNEASSDLAAGGEAISIRDVTTCYLPCETSFIELVVALTGTSNLIFCAGISPKFDCQAMHDCILQIQCNMSDLTILRSVGSVLISMDRRGKAHYVDIWRWLLQHFPPDPQNNTIPEDLLHSLFSNLKESDADKSPKVDFTAVPFQGDIIMAVEASLNIFLFCTTIGDVYSWSPMAGGAVVRHKELNSEIIVQIACGASHLAALSDRGILFTSGEGTSGQLGCGTLQTFQTFQLVPVTALDRVHTVCCGWASTSVLTENGKVYFWGQLDLPEGEKTRKKLSSITAAAQPIDIPNLLEETQSSSSPAGYKLDIIGDVGTADNHLAVVGRLFEVEISKRNENSQDSTCTEFRAEIINCQDPPNNLHSKGKIKQSLNADGVYVASMVFYSEGSFKVSITRNGKNLLGSPFKVKAEKSVTSKRTKLSLISSDTDCMREVGGVLQKAIGPYESWIQLMGVPVINTDLLTQVAFMMTSMTDSGIYVYVWDACNGSLPEEDLNFWLHLLSQHASSADIILLGINISTTHANDIDLEPFQKVNPKMKRSILVGTTFASEPDKLLEELLLVLSETNCHQSPVWYRLDSLASKVLELKMEGIEHLDYSKFKSLASECGIQGDHLCRRAANYLERTGLGILIGADSFFLVLLPRWFERQLTEVTRLSHFGSLSRKVLDLTKQHIVKFLIEKRVAVETRDRSAVYIIPRLTSKSITAKNWPPVEESKYTIYRHLVFEVPPYHVHSSFHSLVANILQKYRHVIVGKYSLVIYRDDQYDCRIDCGPCFVNKTVLEVRVTVRAHSQDVCKAGADETLRFLKTRFTTCLGYCEIKVSCRACRQHYFDLSLLQEAAALDEDRCHCERCHDKKSTISDMLNGFKDTQSMPALEWHPAGDSHCKPDDPRSNTLTRPVMRYFGDHVDKVEAKVLREIRERIEDLTKVFMDLKNYDVPRTICLLPEFQNRSSVLKVNAIKRLLTFGQPKYRLFLLCEGNGDGSGVHFLDSSKHEGYRLESIVAADLIKKSVNFLRFTLQLLINLSSVASIATTLFDGEETLNTVLGTIGLSGAVLSGVRWKNVFKEMDGFLKTVEETSGSIPQPKSLTGVSGTFRGYQLGGEHYEYLREVLSKLGTKDNFGGLRQEPREGFGAIWVCEKHSKYSKDTKAFNIIP